MNDAMAAMGAIDPVAAFEKTLHDAVQVVQLFTDEESPMTTEEFLMAIRTAGQRLKALSTFTMGSIVSGAAHKIDPVERAAFEQRMDLEEIGLSPDEQGRRMLKVLQGLAKAMLQ